MKVELRVTAGPAAGQQFTFDKPDCFLFGRSEEAHISLPNDPYVSRQHFLLEISPPDCKLTDLNSKNGVFVNGVRYGGRNPPIPGIRQAPNEVKEVHLKDRDEIIVGDTRIHISIAQSFGFPANVPAAPQVTGRVPQIPGYRIEQKIGQGKMGVVYKAREQHTGAVVALKIVSPRTALEPHNIRQFQRELEVLSQLQHEHIARLFRHGQAGGDFYFIVEYVDGMNLVQFLETKGGSLTLEEAAPLMLGILDGLAYAHRVKITMRTAQGKDKVFRGIVHQDLKPQNILLTHQKGAWFAKITDFGLSKGFESSGFTNITSPEQILRAPIYWPREQITHYTFPVPASDVFAIAAVFYEMLTGHWVRNGFQELFYKMSQQREQPSISEYLQVILANPTIPIRQRRQNIPAPLAKVIDRALRETEIPQSLSKMREILLHLRYRDAGEFRNALVQAFKEIGSRTQVNKTLPSPSRKISPSGVDVPTAGAVVYSTITPTKQKEVALLVLDLEQSTQYVLDKGDTSFSTLVGKMYRRIKNHASALDLIFLKCTGDGFLLAFQTMPAAFSLAASFLETPIHADMRIRMALHWGYVRTGPDGDVLGAEVHRAARIEGVKIEDRIAQTDRATLLPEADRILISKPGLHHLPVSLQGQFKSVGVFKLKNFENPCELWNFTR
ncbi:serine/threonine protein kinase with FHA domain [Candidatus Vecturithrix granuli]|uniref:Serine/threonine protein kinase with FHA domain n=1 Tax=Vecturithrix granuli TaxID=1499967 RepID=A0A081BXG6_VECG1|nr:serine/threonine protein kinase with FHA domain [Candidatus Vecturithrix granuli]